MAWLNDRVPLQAAQEFASHKDRSGAPSLRHLLPGRHDDVLLPRPSDDRDFVDAVLPPLGRSGLRVGRVHHDHRSVWLADPIHPFMVRKSDGFLRLYSSRHGLLHQVLPQAARDDLDQRLYSAFHRHGLRLFGLPVYRGISSLSLPPRWAPTLPERCPSWASGRYASCEEGTV